MSGAIEKSTDVMKAMQGLVRIPEIQASMMELSKEMSKVSYMDSSLSITAIKPLIPIKIHVLNT